MTAQMFAETGAPTAQMFAETGAPFGLLDSFSNNFRRSGSSTLNLDVIAEPVRLLVGKWERFATPIRESRHHYIALTGTVELVGSVDLTVPTLEEIPAREVRPFPETPVQAVEYLSGLMDISRDAVLRGTGVSESSFYRWKRMSDVAPRPDSLGRLWPTVRALSQLEAVHPNLASWYHSTPEAQEAFEGGRLNRLIHLEFEWLRTNAKHEGSRGLSSASVEAPWFGDPGDRSGLAELEGSQVEDDGDGGRSQAAPLKSQSARLSRTSGRARGQR